jgi:hypothetical protein
MGPTDTVVVKSRFEVVTNTRGILTVRTTSSGTLNDKPFTVLGPIKVNSFDLQTGKPLAGSDMVNASGLSRLQDACLSTLLADFTNALTAKQGTPPSQASLDIAKSSDVMLCNLSLSKPILGNVSVEASGIRLVFNSLDEGNSVTALVPWSDLSGTLQGAVADFAKSAH